MTALAAVNPAAAPAARMTLLERHAAFVAGLDCHDQAKRLRRNGAQALLRRHADLARWMERPTVDRIAEARRLYAWPFLSWCFAIGVLRPDVELLIARSKGAHYITWARMHPDQVDRVAQTAQEMGWVPEWVDRVSVTALATVCMTRQTTLTEITLDDLAVVRADISASVAVLPRCRASQRGLLHSLHTVCYQLGVVDSPPEHGNARHTTIEQRMASVTQPVIRDAFVRYLRTVATTLRPKTVESRAASLTLFGGWLGQHHLGITTLRQLRRHHLEEFLAYDAGRACQGKVAGSSRTISVTHHARAVRDLRAFFDDITIWGWADRPPALVLHRGDIPRLPAPLPRALPPDVDRAFMQAVHQLDDTAARAGIVLLRGTGMRLGELLDLELGCLWELPGHGTWLKVPLGKLNTERVVPLDADTLTALDAWLAVRGRQRALTHPRHGRPADFLFVIAGARIGPNRLRRGIADAIDIAGLADPSGQPLRITPHQLRHTYATTLVNAGMSLQALMALLGHVSPQMTLRYAALANGTVRGAYDAAMAKVHQRRPLPIVVAGRPVVPDRIAWLDSEMIKTRVAHGYCSRHLAAEACPYANICENCDNYQTSVQFLPQLQDQLADARALHDDALDRGWDSEVARHARLIASLQRHVDRLKRDTPNEPVA
jgi:site-specific recombinase XerD